MWSEEQPEGKAGVVVERECDARVLRSQLIVLFEVSPSSLSVSCAQRLQIRRRSPQEHGPEEAAERQQKGEEVDQSAYAAHTQQSGGRPGVRTGGTPSLATPFPQSPPSSPL